jgi:hypothetical protein
VSEFRVNDAVLPIEWHLPEPGISRYATHMFIQRSDNEFILTFYEVQPPLIIGNESVTSAQAESVARIIVSPQRMAEFVEMFRQIPLED